jgi:hypothetical protein
MRTLRAVASLAAGAATALAVAAATPRPAEACGGCFGPTDTVTNVDSHRMVIALSAQKTILWDQIRYSGNPADFVWVLPVPSPETEIALAAGSFFDELDGQTAPLIQGPSPPLCPGSDVGSSGGIGCGAMAADSAGDDDGAGALDAGVIEPPVTIYETEVVGPYETVIIGSENPKALHEWLVEHGYNVPEATLPVIQHYVALGSVFVVLRLAPGQGVEAMQPVRVTYPGYMATFPLKMVTVGASGALELSLWVFAEQRFESGNYPTVEIDQNDLVWDFAAGRSNYREIFDATIDQAGGRGWIAEQAASLDSLFLWSEDSQLELDAIRAIIPYPFETRLRTRMLVDHIVDDLELRPSAESWGVDSRINVFQSVNAPTCAVDDAEPEPDQGACNLTLPRRARATVFPLALGLVVIVALRRRRPRRPRS